MLSYFVFIERRKFMPNWCATDIQLFFPDEEKAEKACDKIESWMKSAKKSDFGDAWLGNILINAGLVTLSDAESGNFPFSCRGSITYLENTNDEVHISTETAWVPMVKMWEAIASKHFPDMCYIQYRGFEPGMNILWTNEPDLPGKYYLDNWGVFLPETNEELSAVAVHKMLVEALKTLQPKGEFKFDLDKISLNGLLRLCEEENLFTNKDFTIEEWKYVPIEELE